MQEGGVPDGPETLSSHALTFLQDGVKGPAKAASLPHGRRNTSDDPKTLSSHVLALLQDGLVSPEPEDTVFARINLLAGWREGLCFAPLMNAPLEPSLAGHSIKGGSLL
jgi:hypothetical protein